VLAPEAPVDIEPVLPVVEPVAAPPVPAPVAPPAPLPVPPPVAELVAPAAPAAPPNKPPKESSPPHDANAVSTGTEMIPKRTSQTFRASRERFPSFMLAS
jgi:deleted-in-malignant-brain-tumors protein 1